MDMKYGEEQSNCIGMIPNLTLTSLICRVHILIISISRLISNTIEFQLRRCIFPSLTFRL